MDRQKFLLKLLAAIFICEFAYIMLANVACGWYAVTHPEVTFMDEGTCSKLGTRSERAFSVAIATSLSLIGAGALNSKNKE